MFILWYIPFILTVIKNYLNSYHGFWLVWTTCEPSGNTITHVMKIEMWCFIIVLHWYCGGAHMNIQWITYSYWSYYFFEICYEMWTTRDDVSARSLGLVDAIPSQLQLISTIIKLKLVFLAKVVFSCLQIPIISKNVSVKHVDSKLPNLHTKMVTKSKILGFHPIDIYCAQHFDMAQYTFTKYYKQIFPQQ